MKKSFMLFSILAMLLFLFIQERTFGINDLLSIFFIFVSTILMFFVIHRLHINNREILRLYTNEGSYAYDFLSGSSKFTYLIAIVISIFSSISMIIILKGLSVSLDGYERLFIIMAIIISSGITLFFIDKMNTKLVKENFKEPVSKHVNTLFHLFLVAFLLNLLLSSVLTYFETVDFLKNNINMDNFVRMAGPNRINYNGYNKLSSDLVNLYIYLDYLKMAVSNLIGEQIFHIQKNNHQFIIGVIIFFFNFMKMIGFSISFVFLQKSFYDMLSSFVKKVTPAYRKGNDSNIKTIVILSAPGQVEEKAGRPASGETGKTLQVAMEMLHKKDVNIFPSANLDDYTIVNSIEDIHYKSKTGRTEGTKSEITDSTNMERINKILKNYDVAFALGDKAKIALENSDFKGKKLISNHPSKQSLNKQYKSKKITPKERNSDRISQWVDTII